MTVRALVPYGQLLDVLRGEGERLATSAVDRAPDLDVPHCPGLTVAETVRHVGSVYRMVLRWLREGDRPSSWQREPVKGQPVERYLRTALAAITDELGAHDPLTVCPTWWPAHECYGFWYRRLAHETTVHRVDVQAAVGQAADSVDLMDEQVALDGIDEVLTLWFAHRLAVLGVSGTRHGRVAVRAGGRTWIACVTPHGTSARQAVQSDPADATVSGRPAAVFLWLWGRASHHAVDRTGDLDAVAQLWALLRLATR